MRLLGELGRVALSAVAGDGWSWPQPSPEPPVPLETPSGPAAQPSIEGSEDIDTRVLEHTWHAFPVNSLPEDWTVDKIRAARRDHDMGQFGASVRLRDVLTTDPRIYAAAGQRAATPTTLPWEVCPADYRNGKGLVDDVRGEIEEMISPKSNAIPPHVMRRIEDDMIWFGVSIVQIIWQPRPDGERWDMRLEPWPMQFAQWNPTLRAYQVMTLEGLVTVRHGDGKWLVFEPYGLRSWLYGAVRPLSMPWADRTYGVRYRSQHAAVHGSPAPIGTLPARVPINSPQGKAFQRLVRMLRDGRTAGVKPDGASIEMLEAKATAGAGVFRQIVDCADADIAIALLGQDGTLQKGNVYTPPMLQGVRFDLVQLDATTTDVGITSGALRIWSIVNFGTDRVCGHLARVIPDPEKEERDAATARRHDGFARALIGYRDAGMKITQDLVDQLADAYDVPAPELDPKQPPLAAAVPPAPPKLPPAPAPRQLTG